LCETIEKFTKKYTDIPPDDVLLIYDNAKVHCEGFGGWFSRQMPGIKLTIPPNSPEFSNFFLLTFFIF